MYNKKIVVIPDDNINRRTHCTNPANAANRTDENLMNRIAKLQDHLSDLSLWNSVRFKYGKCFKFNAKYILTLEIGMQKLFETNVNQNANALPRTVDAKIVCTGAMYIMQKQFQLD